VKDWTLWRKEKSSALCQELNCSHSGFSQATIAAELLGIFAWHNGNLNSSFVW
jgi:hypothetical protein